MNRRLMLAGSLRALTRYKLRTSFMALGIVVGVAALVVMRSMGAGAQDDLLAKIEREIEGHSEESPGLIRLKMNALEDLDVTRALYRASQAGVQVDMIVRDTCRLRRGIPGLSDNVRVISLVGRFLEHARIFYFQNGGDEEYLIGSADTMKRNLESRVEVVTPIEAPKMSPWGREHTKNVAKD